MIHEKKREIGKTPACTGRVLCENKNGERALGLSRHVCEESELTFQKRDGFSYFETTSQK